MADKNTQEKTIIPSSRWRDLLRWEAYKHFFHIAILRYLVLWFSLVPVLASLLRGLPHPLKIPVGSESISLSLELPFTWQILWLSSVFFLLALTVYHLRCPKFIKKYNNYEEYKTYGHDHRWLAWEARDLVREEQGLNVLVKRLITKKYLAEEIAVFKGENNPIVEELQTKLYFTHGGKHYILAMPPIDGDHETAVRGVFWELFGRYSSSRFCARVTICILLALSAGLFISSLAEHVYVGAGYVYEWIRLWF